MATLAVCEFLTCTIPVDQYDLVMQTESTFDPDDDPRNTIEVPPAASTNAGGMFPDFYSSLPTEVVSKIRAGRKSKLYYLITYAPDIYKQILKYIELGAFGYVVAEAIGITNQTWQKWLRESAKAPPGTYQHRFITDVRRAEAKARMLVEMQVRRDNPEFWLRHGPGKSLPDRPGWTELADDAQTGLEGFGGGATKEDVSNADLAETLRVANQLGLTNLLLENKPNEESDDDPGEPLS